MSEVTSHRDIQMTHREKGVCPLLKPRLAERLAVPHLENHLKEQGEIALRCLCIVCVIDNVQEGIVKQHTFVSAKVLVQKCVCHTCVKDVVKWWQRHITHWIE